MDTPITYKTPSYNEHRALAGIRKANARLTRAGITDLFTYDLETVTEVVTHPNTGRKVMKKFVLFTLNRPVISYDGWSFVARIDTLASGALIAMAAPGTQLDRFTPASLTCEQCHAHRARAHVYVVEKGGNWTVVGPTSLELFLGVKPGGLWV